MVHFKKALDIPFKIVYYNKSSESRLMPNKQIPPQEYLDYLKTLNVDSVNGIIRDVHTSYNKKTGRAFLWIRPKGTRGLSIARADIIWYVCKRYWALPTIDHRNRIPSDDRIENLRPASHSTQRLNRDYSLNRNLPPGIHFHESRKKFVAQLWRDGKIDVIGASEDLDELTECLDAARKDYNLEVVL